MISIINGKRYNTDTATLIACHDNGLGRSDFGRTVEVVYITTKGALFLHGEGGAASRYAEPCSGMWGPGSRIIPLTNGEAIAMLEAWGATDALETHFGDYIADA